MADRDIRAMALGLEYAAPPLLKDATKGSLLDYLDVPRIKIEHFCNGLLLCSSAAYLLKPAAGGAPANLVDYCSYVVNDDDRGQRYFICNPPKRQFQRLAFPS
ncbi:hypothetical protein Peur_016012 [Populus x canadensis]